MSDPFRSPNQNVVVNWPLVGACILVLILTLWGCNTLMSPPPGSEELGIHTSYLPPGTLPEQAPIPKLVLKGHVGGDWVVCKGQTNWSTIYYYPNEVRIISNQVVSESGMNKYIITVQTSAGGGQVNEFTETFETPLLLGDNPLFIQTSSRVIEDLIARIGSSR